MKILIAVPTFENIFPDTYKAIYALDPGDNELMFDFVRGYDCATARNRIAQEAIDIGADYVLMVDNDVVAPEDTVINFLEEPETVCLGYYAHRDADNLYRGRTSVCRLYDESGKKYFNYPLESEYTAEEMNRFKSEGRTKMQIHGGGMGCAFIKTSIFEKIRYPWFDWVNYGDEKRGMLSEDLFFCERCRKAGIPVYTDVRVGCGHMMRYVQWPV